MMGSAHVPLCDRTLRHVEIVGPPPPSWKTMEAGKASPWQLSAAAVGLSGGEVNHPGFTTARTGVVKSVALPGRESLGPKVGMTKPDAQMSCVEGWRASEQKCMAIGFVL